MRGWILLGRGKWGAIALAVFLVSGSAGTAFASQGEGQRESWLDAYNRTIFEFNKSFFEFLEDDKSAVQPAAVVAPEPPSPLKQGLHNMAMNFVQEPMSMLAAGAAGEWGAASQSAARFAINSTVGLLGFYDRAGQWGIGPYGNDLGVVLCARGVNEGPYVVLPFIGPRTLRDGVVDVVIANAILAAMVFPLLPSASAVQTLAALQTVELAAEVATARELDPQAKALGFDSYEGMRDTYLSNRRARCESVRQSASNS